MAFNSKSSTNNKVNTTTRVCQIYNDMANEDSGTLTMGFWNQYATLAINPALPVKEREQGKVYNYDVQASVVLNAEACTTLYQAILHMEQQHNKGNLLSVAVKAGQYVVKVGPTSDYEGMTGKYYLGLFEVDNKGVATGSMFYVFAQQEDNSDDTIMYEWNEDTGKAETTKVLNTQWIMFKNFIKLASETLVQGGSHGAMAQMNIKMTRLSNALDTIKNLIDLIVAGKGGSSMQQETKSTFGGGFGSGRKRNASGSAGRRSRTAEATQSQAPVEESVDDINDILKDFAASIESIDDIDDL